MTVLQRTELLARFICETLADEPFDHLSRDKYFNDAAAILEFLAAQPQDSQP